MLPAGWRVDSALLGLRHIYKSGPHGVSPLNGFPFALPPMASLSLRLVFFILALLVLLTAAAPIPADAAAKKALKQFKLKRGDVIGRAEASKPKPSHKSAPWPLFNLSIMIYIYLGLTSVTRRRTPSLQKGELAVLIVEPDRSYGILQVQKVILF
ncbi:hypothetical protein HGRIS_013670 [Hohenbuehelia grisea]|uniref:Uncharacterized protein n=1 Tax=Hohenbuehelia grisea TaxID=104357 RepID=A0ABR3IW71_9AGAR